MSQIALDESKKLDKISAMTDAYLADPDIQEAVTDCMELLHSNEALWAVTGNSSSLIWLTYVGTHRGKDSHSVPTVIDGVVQPVER
jgi:hypothetical protein